LWLQEGPAMLLLLHPSFRLCTQVGEAFLLVTHGFVLGHQHTQQLLLQWCWV
jgi:hypothetical protein